MAAADNATKLRRGLHKFFNWKRFRNSRQEQATLKVFEGDNDVYLNMQPGAGKSLCFQLPTLLKANAVTVVFVPSDVAAKDQIFFLRQRQIKAEYLSKQTRRKALEATMLDLRSKKSSIRFLYILAYNRNVHIAQDCLVKLKENNKLSYIVYDEAHCVSPLSDNYVPGYQDMAKLVENICPDICKIAVTSTATKEVRQDLLHRLDLKNTVNLRSAKYYNQVFHDVYFIDLLPDPLDHLARFVFRALKKPAECDEMHPRCGIIFCRRKQEIRIVMKNLTSKDFPAVAYHGDLTLPERNLICERWMNGDIRIIVTVSGKCIGLHNPNVRFVVHWNLPTSFQQLYRECGNIAQDGKRAYCRVYHSCDEEEDILKDLITLSAKSNECIDAAKRKIELFEEVLNYCFQTTCRQVARHVLFGREISECGKYCDACADSEIKNRLSKIQAYRVSMKKAIVEGLAHGRVNVIQPLDHRRSFERLYHELRENYKKTREGFEGNLTNSDIFAVACRLVNSLYIAKRPHKAYSIDVARVALQIRKCTESGVVSSYFKYTEIQGNTVFTPKPIAMEFTQMDDDGDDSNDSVVKLVTPEKKEPELVDLRCSSPESETP